MSKKRVNFMFPEAFPGQNQIIFYSFTAYFVLRYYFTASPTPPAPPPGPRPHPRTHRLSHLHFGSERNSTGL